jgi:hypothetical protein
MKRTAIFLTGLCFALTSLAQTDTTKKQTPQEGDTIRIGNIIIIKDGKNQDDDNDNDDDVRVERRKNYKPSNLSTNWWIVDLGISQFNDKTNYGHATSTGYLAPGLNEESFNLRNGKSINVNIWVFMQRLNVVKHYVNLKYGLGIEMNNYRFTEDIRFTETNLPRVKMEHDSVDFSKNKLAADYVTLPMLLNFNFTPERKRGFGISIGASVGYLYNSRQKTVGGPMGKHKEHDDFDLEKWKLSYIGEMQLGPIKLYGSYATKSMFKNGLDFTPYNVGIRLSNW